MSKPVVAIVGRPNVGKSSLFNALYGERISIVHDEPGVTRDRLYATAVWRDREFLMIDTGGIEPETDDIILKGMRAQAEIAMEAADVILFMCDIQSGLTAADEEIAVMLRKSKRPVVVCVNKVDTIGDPPSELYEFYNLGLGDVLPISSSHRLGIGEMLDAVFANFPAVNENENERSTIRVALIGKPNAGKSSLSNFMTGEERSIVSDIPGTTRDAIDSLVENQYGHFTIIDTAGLRKKSRIEEAVEKYSMIRSLSAIEKADVCVILIDATEGVTEQDTKVAGYAHNAGKACVFAVNKWDLVDKETGTMEAMQKMLMERFSFMSYAPSVFISAKTGQRVDKLFAMIAKVYENSGRRLTTGVLNDLLTECVAMVPTPQDKGKHLKIYYGTQIATYPPQFILFVNDRNLMHFSYERYLENQFRKNFDFVGTPLRIYMRQKEKKD
ncbi:MAG TPA: ribosome biogenesis GTPase Der [Bacillota bacterium]|nr:ribosome biogenesis GTPase Der [Bacillota bacterium]HPE38366.1 ribosome biogenesis GTPase Der [Bacillota bacterium]